MLKYVAIKHDRGRWHISAETGRAGDRSLNLNNQGYSSRIDAMQAAMIYAKDNGLDIVELSLG